MQKNTEFTHILCIKVLPECPNRDDIVEYYTNIGKNTSYKGDSGIDIIFPEDLEFSTNCVKICNMGIACEMLSSVNNVSESYNLYPRSSIVNTPLMLANSVGVIDSGYRGPIKAALRCFVDRNHPSTIDNFNYYVKKGNKLVQIVAFDGKPIKVVIVDELSTTDRGDNGFGSTNK